MLYRLRELRRKALRRASWEVACKRRRRSLLEDGWLIDLETAALREGSTISLAPLYYGGCDRSFEATTSRPRCGRFPGSSKIE